MRKRRSRRWGAPTAEAGRTSHFASYRRSAREPSTAPSARRGRWSGVFPRHHGQGSRSRRGWAGEVRMPRTFSITTRQGWRASMARATWCQRPERVSGARPARRPATEMSLAGEACGQDADLRDGGPVDGGDVAEVGDAGPVAGEDAGGVGVGFGVPGDVGVVDGFGGEVEAAVSAAQGADGAVRRHVRGFGRYGARAGE